MTILYIKYFTSQKYILKRNPKFIWGELSLNVNTKKIPEIMLDVDENCQWLWQSALNNCFTMMRRHFQSFFSLEMATNLPIRNTHESWQVVLNYQFYVFTSIKILFSQRQLIGPHLETQYTFFILEWKTTQNKTSHNYMLSVTLIFSPFFILIFIIYWNVPLSSFVFSFYIF